MKKKPEEQMRIIKNTQTKSEKKEHKENDARMSKFKKLGANTP